MRCIALIDHGPNWRPDRSVYEQGPPIEAHLVAMRHRYDDGNLLIGGPFASHRGGVAVLDVADEAEARRLMDADPAVIAGVMTYRLETVLTYFDAYSGIRTASAAVDLDPTRSTR